MTKKKEEQNEQTTLINPLFQQILALLVTALGTITLLAAFRVTRGQWSDAWVDLLRYWLGWGVYPAALSIILAGLLWLQHHLDRSTKWRWRPFVGAELVFFGLLALTHAIAGRGDLWGLVEEGWGGGLVGWAISVILLTYMGWPATVVILLAALVFGLGFAFDLTSDDVKRSAGAMWKQIARVVAHAATRRRDYRAHRSDRSGAAVQRVQARPRPAVREEPPLPRERPDSEPRRAAPVPIEVEQVTAPAHVTPLPNQRKFLLPSLDLLSDAEEPVLSDEEVRKKSQIIKRTLAQFGLPVEVIEVRVGPVVTQFGVEPGFVEHPQAGGRKVRVQQISSRAQDLALALATPRLRIEAPVPGRAFVGIEVPNSQVQLVGIREVMASEEFRKLDSPLAFALGHNVAGDPVVADLARMPHLLIAGTTGSGKSICIKAITTCLIYNNTPDKLRLVMIDPKMVELVRFNGLPHLYGKVEVDLERVVKVLRWVALEMDDRYRRFAEASARHLDDYNREMMQREEPIVPRLVVLIDELADLMMLAPDAVERLLCRIAQMGRATGIHLIVATQRPSTDVVTGLIKANFPARISFATTSQVDSRVILDIQGAETLLGGGDMLYVAADAGHPVRVQGCFVSEEELDRVVNFWREQAGPIEERTPWERIMPSGKRDDIESEDDSVEEDLLQKAIKVVQKQGQASASLLQRKLRIGHPRAARLMQTMEEMGIVGPAEAAGRTRHVIIGGGGDYD